MARTKVIAPLLFLGLLILGGCATPAARELTVAASNYDARSLEAINAVDAMARRETEPPPRLERAAEDEFVSNVRSLNQSQVTPANIERALDPYATNLAAETAARTEILDRMRQQHAAFIAIFAEVERAGMLGKRTMAQRVPPVLDLLIAQQVTLANMLTSETGRPRLLAYRSALTAEFASALTQSMTDAEREAALRNLRRRWLEMRAQEDQLLASASGPLLTAAATGLALHRLLKDYGSLSLAELQSILQETIGFVGAVTGRDTTALSGQVQTLVARINADPDFSSAARQLLQRVQVPGAPTVPSAPTAQPTQGE